MRFNPPFRTLASLLGFALQLWGLSLLAGLSLEAGAGGDGGRVVLARGSEALIASTAVLVGLTAYAATARGRSRLLAPAAAMLGLFSTALTGYLAIQALALGHLALGAALLALALATLAASAYTGLKMTGRRPKKHERPGPWKPWKGVRREY
ncbi:MAG: hypothetical protein F7B17_05590 [Desulfurococcales archaeon]|nr:hypothetical protein [Desulfurococcales archaeon]